MGWLAAACGALLGLLGCSETIARTQLMVVADTDIDDLEVIRFEVSGDGETQTAESRAFDAEPASLALVPKGSKLGPLTVTARGLRSDATVIQRSAEVSFVAHQTLVVQLHLLASCVGVTCGDNESCTEQGCSPRALNSDSLAPWEGEPPRIGGADVDAALDAGADAGPSVDGSTDPDDAGAQLDGGSEAAVDAGPDANCNPDGALVDLDTDVNNCGMCRNVCRPPQGLRNTVAVCNMGACATQCRPNFDDCDDNPNNGCEQSLLAPNHCGMCGTMCGMGQSCRLGTCL
jgi:hypothetical protein